jgi:hypothetical protein
LLTTTAAQSLKEISIHALGLLHLRFHSIKRGPMQRMAGKIAANSPVAPLRKIQLVLKKSTIEAKLLL